MKFFHLQSSDPGRIYGLTFSYEIMNDIVFFSYAKCSKKDQFNKRLGREIASGRLHKTKHSFPISSKAYILNDMIRAYRNLEKDKKYLLLLDNWLNDDNFTSSRWEGVQRKFVSSHTLQS